MLFSCEAEASIISDIPPSLPETETKLCLVPSAHREASGDSALRLVKREVADMTWKKGSVGEKK